MLITPPKLDIIEFNDLIVDFLSKMVVPEAQRNKLIFPQKIWFGKEA
jgi:hypothetical protein